MEVSEKKRDPRTAAELEKIFPGRMWVIARTAAEHGWDISVRPTRDGWGLYLTEDHHCVHLFWKPNVKVNSEQHPWDLYRSSLATRCPHPGRRVHIRDLPVFLAMHPDECADTHTRRPLGELYVRPECADHMVPAKRDPLNATVLASVDVVDVAEHARTIYGEEGARAVLPPDVPYLENDYRFEYTVNGGTTSFHRGATAEDIAAHLKRQQEWVAAKGWMPGDPFNDGQRLVPGYVVGRCGHRVAQSEWEAGFDVCERCA